ncbi:hypothetical protein PGTUg99_003399 [Puccinia graminis f. sp. tritici]|uniref:Uncharacterized protein n=1 Tax=Puccinia graminis f. sp. tritici TaxID=56615 RepID=A0A5B0RNJ8_PUCGR|nr:hypothetical protein PGTUg99_003399 [Puccinia graminis f. sp. tritici]
MFPSADQPALLPRQTATRHDREEETALALQPIPEEVSNPGPHMVQPAIHMIPSALAESLGLSEIDPSSMALVSELMRIPEEQQWPITAMMLVRAMQIYSAGPPPYQRVPTQQIVHAFPAILQAYTTTPHGATRRPRSTPMTLTLIRNAYHDGEIDPSMMPRGYAQMRTSAMDPVFDLCQQLIEQAKVQYRNMLLENIAPFDEIETHGPVPKLDDLIQSVWGQLQINPAEHLGPLPSQPEFNAASKPEFNADRVRMAHIRLHMVHHKYALPESSLSEWSTLDQELYELAQKDQKYQIAHAQSILIRDHELFNGINTLASIPHANLRLPTADEISMRLEIIEKKVIDAPWA